MSTDRPENPTSEALQVPFPRIATFIRQITHDIRNNLNSMDLQAAYVAELVTEGEAADEVKRIRALIQTSARQLQAISAQFQTAKPNLVTYTAGILVEDLQDRLKKQLPEHAGDVRWSSQMGEEAVEVDVELFFSAVIELFRNAFQFRKEKQPIDARAAVESGSFVIEITEPKPEPPSTDPAGWGTEPFVSTRRSGYGLGLFRAKKIFTLHGGDLTILYDSPRAQLRTRVLLPVVASS